MVEMLFMQSLKSIFLWLLWQMWEVMETTQTVKQGPKDKAVARSRSTIDETSGRSPVAKRWRRRAVKCLESSNAENRKCSSKSSSRSPKPLSSRNAVHASLP